MLSLKYSRALRAVTTCIPVKIRVCRLCLLGKLSIEKASACTWHQTVSLDFRNDSFKTCSILAPDFSASDRDQYHLSTTAGAFVKKWLPLSPRERIRLPLLKFYGSSLHWEQQAPARSNELCCLSVIMFVSWKGGASSPFYQAPPPSIYHYLHVHSGTRAFIENNSVGNSTSNAHWEQHGWLMEWPEGSQAPMVGCEAVRKKHFWM